jgi:hypothetical protein
MLYSPKVTNIPILYGSKPTAESMPTGLGALPSVKAAEAPTGSGNKAQRGLWEG